MNSDARRTLLVIRECIEEDRYALAIHFVQRMEERGLFWPDVQAVVDDPHDVRSQGVDKFHRPKWLIRGTAATGGQIEIVCAVEIDESGTEFITLYWED